MDPHRGAGGRLHADARRQAVLDARERAEAYAAALGLSDLKPLALADAGMLGDRLSGPAGDEMAMYAAAKAGGQVVEFQPEDVSVTVSVDARFVAS